MFQADQRAHIAVREDKVLPPTEICSSKVVSSTDDGDIDEDEENSAPEEKELLPLKRNSGDIRHYSQSQPPPSAFSD
jgi:hypothetical protein